MKEEREQMVSEISELVTALHKLPQKEREKFLYMAQGAALVADAMTQREQTEVGA